MIEKHFFDDNRKPDDLWSFLKEQLPGIEMKGATVLSIDARTRKSDCIEARILI